jgi:hypothetical protein
MFAALSVNDVSNVRLSGTTFYAGNASQLGAAFASDGGRSLLASGASIILGLVLLTLSFVSQAGLIWATGQSLQREKVTLRASVRETKRCLKPFLIVTLVLFGPFYVASLLLGPILLTMDLANWALTFIALLVGGFVAIIVITIVHQLAQRAVVLQTLGARASLTLGWQVFQRHTRQWIITLICLSIVSLAYTALMSIILVPLTQASVFPALFAWIQTGSISTTQMLSIAGVSLLALVLFAPMNAYQSVALTLAYYHLNQLNLTQPRQRKRRVVQG